jgi:hypothetical protein
VVCAGALATLIALACFAGAASCTLTTDLDGLRAASGAMLPDGASEAGSGGDAGLDSNAPIGEAGANEAGKSDGGTEAGTTSPCGAMHAFCADFDDGILITGWTTTVLDTGGTIAIDDLALSPLHSMRATRPRKTTAGGLRASLRKSLAPQWRRAIFQADAYLVQPDWLAGDTNVAVVQLGYNSVSGNTGTTFFLSAAAGAGTIEHITDSTRGFTVDLLPYGRWVHVFIDFDPSGKVHYEIDGKTSERTFAAVTAGANPELLLELGIIDFNNPIPAVDIRWDNVVVDLP